MRDLTSTYNVFLKAFNNVYENEFIFSILVHVWRVYIM